MEEQELVDLNTSFISKDSSNYSVDITEISRSKIIKAQMNKIQIEITDANDQRYNIPSFLLNQNFQAKELIIDDADAFLQMSDEQAIRYTQEMIEKQRGLPIKYKEQVAEQNAEKEDSCEVIMKNWIDGNQDREKEVLEEEQDRFIRDIFGGNNEQNLNEIRYQQDSKAVQTSFKVCRVDNHFIFLVFQTIPLLIADQFQTEMKIYKYRFNREKNVSDIEIVRTLTVGNNGSQNIFRERSVIQNEDKIYFFLIENDYIYLQKINLKTLEQTLLQKLQINQNQIMGYQQTSLNSSVVYDSLQVLSVEFNQQSGLCLKSQDEKTFLNQHFVIIKYEKYYEIRKLTNLSVLIFSKKYQINLSIFMNKELRQQVEDPILSSQLSILKKGKYNLDQCEEQKPMFIHKDILILQGNNIIIEQWDLETDQQLNLNIVETNQVSKHKEQQSNIKTLVNFETTNMFKYFQIVKIDSYDILAEIINQKAQEMLYKIVENLDYKPTNITFINDTYNNKYLICIKVKDSNDIIILEGNAYKELHIDKLDIHHNIDTSLRTGNHYIPHYQFKYTQFSKQDALMIFADNSIRYYGTWVNLISIGVYPQVIDIMILFKDKSGNMKYRHMKDDKNKIIPPQPEIFRLFHNSKPDKVLFQQKYCYVEDDLLIRPIINISKIREFKIYQIQMYNFKTEEVYANYDIDLTDVKIPQEYIKKKNVQICPSSPISRSDSQSETIFTQVWSVLINQKFVGAFYIQEFQVSWIYKKENSNKFSFSSKIYLIGEKQVQYPLDYSYKICSLQFVLMPVFHKKTMQIDGCMLKLSKINVLHKIHEVKLLNFPCNVVWKKNKIVRANYNQIISNNTLKVKVEYLVTEVRLSNEIMDQLSDFTCYEIKTILDIASFTIRNMIPKNFVQLIQGDIKRMDVAQNQEMLRIQSVASFKLENPQYIHFALKSNDHDSLQHRLQMRVLENDLDTKRIDFMHENQQIQKCLTPSNDFDCNSILLRCFELTRNKFTKLMEPKSLRLAVANIILTSILEEQQNCKKLDLMIKFILDQALIESQCPKILHRYFSDLKYDSCNKLFHIFDENDLPSWYNGKQQIRNFDVNKNANTLEISSWVKENINQNESLLGTKIHKVVHGFIDFRYIRFYQKLQIIKQEKKILNSNVISTQIVVSKMMHTIISQFPENIDQFNLIKQIIKTNFKQSRKYLIKQLLVYIIFFMIPFVVHIIQYRDQNVFVVCVYSCLLYVLYLFCNLFMVCRTFGRDLKGNLIDLCLVVFYAIYYLKIGIIGKGGVNVYLGKEGQEHDGIAHHNDLPPQYSNQFRDLIVQDKEMLRRFAFLVTIYLLIIFTAFLRFNNLIKLSSSLRNFVLMYSHAVYDTAIFNVIMFLFMVFFSKMFILLGWQLQKNEVYDGVDPNTEYLITVYRNSIGDIKTPKYDFWANILENRTTFDIDDNTPNQNDSRHIFQAYANVTALWTTWIISIYFMFIMLLNFLISIIGQTYANLFKNKEFHDNFDRSLMNENKNILFDKLGLLDKGELMIFSLSRENHRHDDEDEDDDDIGVFKKVALEIKTTTETRNSQFEQNIRDLKEILKTHVSLEVSEIQSQTQKIEKQMDNIQSLLQELKK